MEHSKSVPANGPAKNIVEMAIAAGNFTNFVAGLRAAGLIETLGRGTFTVFVPTDEAFKRLPSGAYEALLKDTSKLKTVLSYHIIPGTFMTKDVKPGELKTLQGSTLTATASPEVKVNGSRVSQPDILATNGVIHAIDAVILPKDVQPLAAAA